MIFNIFNNTVLLKMSRSRTKTPSIGSFFGTDEDYFESPSRSRENYTSPETSREFKKRLVKELKPTEEDDLGIKDLLDEYEPSFANEENRKYIRNKYKEGEIETLYKSVINNENMCIFPYTIPIYLQIPSIFTTYKDVSIDDFIKFQENLQKNINTGIAVERFGNMLREVNRFFPLLVNFFQNIDIQKFRDECIKKYIVFSIFTYTIVPKDGTFITNAHALILIYVKDTEEGYIIDPASSNNPEEYFLILEDKLKYFMQLFFNTDIEIIKRISSFDKSEINEIVNLNNFIKELSKSITINFIRNTCPQSIVNDKNCLFWSLFLTDIIIRNFDPEKDYTPEKIIDRILTLYPRPKQLETIILKYITYLIQNYKGYLPVANYGGYIGKVGGGAAAGAGGGVPGGIVKREFGKSPSRSRSINSHASVYSPSSPSRTISPNLRSFFGTDEDYFEYTPVPKVKTKTKTKTKTISPRLNFLYGDEDDF